MVTEGPLTVVEGQDGIDIDVQVLVNPNEICNAPGNSTCEIRIEVQINHPGDDFSCASGVKIAQAVVGWDISGEVADAFCGAPLMLSNWEDIIRIPIKAMIDGVIDEDVTRYDHDLD